MKLITFIALVLISQATCKVQAPAIVLTGANITEGIYTFSDPATGLNLAIEKESVEDQAFAVLAKASDSNSQKFLVKEVIKGSYVIANVKSGKYISYHDDRVAQLTLTYTSEQQWVIRERVNGEFYLEPALLTNKTANPAVGEGKKLTFIYEGNVKNGFKATPTTINAADSYKLEKELIAALTFKSDKKVAAGVYTIGVLSTGHVLDHAKTGKQIVAAAASDVASQQFKIEANAEGLYRIVNAKSGEAVVTTGNQNDGGSEIDQVPVVEKDLKQWWNIVERGDGVWSIINAHSKESITIPAGENANQQYFVGTTTQLFTLKAVQAK